MNKSVEAKLCFAVDVKRHLVNARHSCRHAPETIKCPGLGGVEAEIDDTHGPAEPKKRLHGKELWSKWTQSIVVGLVGLAAPNNDGNDYRRPVGHRGNVLVDRLRELVVPPSPQFFRIYFHVFNSDDAQNA